MSIAMLRDINSSKTGWKIRVRITRMWKNVYYKDKTYKGQGLIVLDEENTHCHAFVYADPWRTSFSAIVREGAIYEISKFYVKKATYRLRPVRTENMITIGGFTNIKPISFDNLSIPFHKFEFVDFNSIKTIAEPLFDKGNSAESPEFAIDLIGAVECFEYLPSPLTTPDDCKDMMRLLLTDGSVCHSITLWSDMAIQVNSLLSSDIVQPAVCIITSLKVGIFNDTIQLSTLSMSKIHINYDCDEVKAIRERLVAENYVPGKLTAVGESVVLMKDNKTLTLSQIREYASKDFVEVITIRFNNMD